MEVLNKIEENTRETKEIALAQAKGLNRALNKGLALEEWNPIQIPSESLAESNLEPTPKVITEQEQANEPERQPQAS